MELGFGATGAWAASWYDEALAEAVLKAALQGGISHFDTAGFYAGGLADKRLATILARLNDQGSAPDRPLTISTKIGKRLTTSGQIVRDFSETAIKEAVARHTDVFGGKAPDIVYMHGPDENERHSSLEVLTRLKAEGSIGSIGDCQDGAGLLAAAQTDGIDVLMARYHFLRPDNDDAFRIAKQAGKKIVSIAPLAQGLWRRGLLIPKGLNDVWALARALRRDPKTLIAAQRARWIRDVEDWPPSHLALGFVRMNRDIDVVLTTSTRLHHLQDTIDGFVRDIPEDIAALLSAHSAA